MFTIYLVITLFAVVVYAFMCIAAIVHFKPILPGMVKVGIPKSWLTFPIGTPKAAGAIGLLLGVLGVPLIGTCAAIGLILFFVCAVYTHLLAGDYSPLQFVLAVATLVAHLAVSGISLQHQLR
jgi:hypothetical protein